MHETPFVANRATKRDSSEMHETPFVAPAAARKTCRHKASSMILNVGCELLEARAVSHEVIE
jgi:hypothetical protein